MAKKESRISINKLESVLKENVVVVPMRDNEDVSITIRRTLPLKDMMQFVENVVSSCVDAQTASYTPEVCNSLRDSDYICELQPALQCGEAV